MKWMLVAILAVIALLSAATGLIAAIDPEGLAGGATVLLIGIAAVSLVSALLVGIFA